MANVINISNRTVDLDDGRIVAPGDEAKKVNLAEPHNENLLRQGLIVELEQPKPKGTTGEDK